MHDNARSYIARIVQEYLEEEEIDIMVWSGKNPDFNPIKHRCDNMGRRILTRQIPMNNLNNLRTVLLDI